MISGSGSPGLFRERLAIRGAQGLTTDFLSKRLASSTAEEAVAAIAAGQVGIQSAAEEVQARIARHAELSDP